MEWIDDGMWMGGWMDGGVFTNDGSICAAAGLDRLTNR
jgi:hypothetical protein